MPYRGQGLKGAPLLLSWQWFTFISIHDIEFRYIFSGCVFIHGVDGVSCSATVLIAYLMIKKHYSLKAAARYVRRKRDACINANFLQQLCDLNLKLQQCGHFKLRKNNFTDPIKWKCSLSTLFILLIFFQHNYYIYQLIHKNSASIWK